MDWFLYDRDHHHETVSIRNKTWKRSIIGLLLPCYVENMNMKHFHGMRNLQFFLQQIKSLDFMKYKMKTNPNKIILEILWYKMKTRVLRFDFNYKIMITRIKYFLYKQRSNKIS